MGYSNFRRIFKEYTGFPPAKYIQEVRIGKAKEALTNSSKPVKQIAYEMGYENEDYFFTVFRRVTGMTPVRYRALTQGGKK
jgi:AraC-like DNA-binding protein